MTAYATCPLDRMITYPPAFYLMVHKNGQLGKVTSSSRHCRSKATIPHAQPFIHHSLGPGNEHALTCLVGHMAKSAKQCMTRVRSRRYFAIRQLCKFSWTRPDSPMVITCSRCTE